VTSALGSIAQRKKINSIVFAFTATPTHPREAVLYEGTDVDFGRPISINTHPC